ncbi:HDIG domain-containing protein [Paenibacillus ginsengarvi]|uniref:HDIG domain-containing protein n=2 Tax=Paenibacillus ginsengarvi TaxID=400777 RepID=A0A3B0CPH1_9BACL|nr:HDIG domain-containing protein [Paenibacillus ginsengarvi]
MEGRLIPQTYDIKAGAASEKTIYATKQIENAIGTQKAKEEAARRVQPVYSILSMKNESLVDTTFEKLKQINADDQLNTNDKASIFRNVFPTMYGDYVTMLSASIRTSDPANDGLLNEVKTALADQMYRIPEEFYFKFPKLSKEDLDEMEPVAKEIVGRLMNDQLLNAQTARTRVAEFVNSSSLSKRESREMVQEIVRFVLTPNKFPNQKATDEARAEARDGTKPVYINKGDVLVHKGELVTEETYERLKAMDLLKEKTNYWPQLGLMLLSGLFVLGLFMFVSHSEHPIRSQNLQLLMLVLIYVLNVFVMKVVSLGPYANIGYLAPVAMGSMLIAILIGTPLALASSMVFALLSSVIFNTGGEQLFDFRYGLLALVVCITSVYAIQQANQRSSILKSGIMVSLSGAVTVLCMTFLDNVYTRSEIMFSFGFTVASGLLTAVLVIGLMPFFEVTFSILSPLKLVELSNPNHPLLRKLLIETPGTYHHSVMVGNLSEAAAESVGANGLLCRVGSYYHDIGKTKRPSYFIENQMSMGNPHDQIEPDLSKSIIIAHARDGVEMLKEHNIPKPIRDIAEQHHGTTLLKFFYFKAKKLQEEGAEPIPEEDYRYPGPKAQSKEAAIVGIADSVEAAVRSLRSPSIEQIDTMVRKIIKDRLDDGQLSDCDLTLRELETIAKTLNEALLGIFHSRIEYPAGSSPAQAETKEAKQA